MKKLGDAEILAERPERNLLDVNRPYGYFVEPERTAEGAIEDVATILLTNRECPYRCLMCDLWKNTTEETVPDGAIPEQIRWALEQLPTAQHIKLYNAGNFFDPRAIPPSDYRAIAELVSDFKTVIVENHPNIIGRRCFEFRDLLDTQLEVAMGLETIDPVALERLNKQMTVEDFARAAEQLSGEAITLRSFILLRAPGQNEANGIDWATKSLEFAFEHHVRCCCVVPTRASNGIMEQLQSQGYFASPSLDSLEHVLQAGIEMQKGRVFVDLWDLERFFKCSECGPTRKQRLNEMNLQQVVLPEVECGQC